MYIYIHSYVFLSQEYQAISCTINQAFHEVIFTHQPGWAMLPILFPEIMAPFLEVMWGGDVPLRGVQINGKIHVVGKTWKIMVINGWLMDD